MPGFMEFIPVFLNRTPNTNQSCKPLYRENHAPNIPHHPVYPAGSVERIALGAPLMSAHLPTKELYDSFSEFTKPAHSTNHVHCPECAEYDSLLEHVRREDLSIEQIGTVCWGPVAFLVPDAMAYYLPRLMELALVGSSNKDGKPFFTQFLVQIGLHAPSEPQFSRLKPRHVALVHRCIEAIGKSYGKEIEEECWEDWLEEALGKWRA